MSEHTTQLVPFQYESAQVRVISIDSEPWFVLADLAAVLEIKDVSRLASRLDDGVRQTHPIVDALGRTQQANIVSEVGMYEVVIRSDKPEAVVFRRWITAEVLPTIRRTGSYGTTPTLTGPELLARAVLEAADTIKSLDAKVAELEPKVEFYDELMEADGTYSMLATAKMLGWGRNVMMRDLRRMGVIQGNNLPYQRYTHHFKVVPGTYVNQKTGETVPTATTYVKPSGVEFLRKKLQQAPAVVEVIA